MFSFPSRPRSHRPAVLRKHPPLNRDPAAGVEDEPDRIRPLDMTDGEERVVADRGVRPDEDGGVPPP